MGNPETSDAEDWRGLVDDAWSHAVISDETQRIVKENCDFNSNNTWENEQCNQAVGEVLKQYKEIDIYSLYTSVCIADSANSLQSSFQVMIKRSSTMVLIHHLQITRRSRTFYDHHDFFLTNHKFTFQLL